MPSGFVLSYFSYKFDSKELILKNYGTEPEKFVVAENFYPQKWEVHVPDLRQKNGFQVNFETPKHGTDTPVCSTKYTLSQNI